MIAPFSKPFSAPFVKPFGPEGVFSPLDIPGLLAWFDASDASTITETSNNVTLWADKSGNGNDVTPPGDPERPETNVQTINGLNAIFFDGGPKLLEKISLGVTADFTLAMVFHMTAVSQVSDSVFSLNSNEGENDDFQIDANDFIKFFGLFDDVGLNVSVSNAPTDLVGSDVALMYRLEFPGPSGVIDLYRSNTLVDTDSGYNGELDGDQDLQIGINRAKNQSPVHHTGEIVLINAAISDDDRTRLFNYFNSKWGV